MAEKNLVVYSEENTKYYNPAITFLCGNPKEESLYAISQWIDSDGEMQEENIELASHIDDMIKMRDYLNRLIEAV